MPQSPDTERLRQYVARARAERGLRANTDVAEAAGIGYRTLVNLLAGKSTRAEAAVEVVLGWGVGSVQQVLAGGEPRPGAAPSATPDAPVRPSSQDAEALRFQRPAGLSDDEWDELRRQQADYWEYLVSKAAKER